MQYGYITPRQIGAPCVIPHGFRIRLQRPNVALVLCRRVDQYDELHRPLGALPMTAAIIGLVRDALGGIPSAIGQEKQGT